MKKIIILYWRTHKQLIPEFEYQREFEYSVEKRNEIIQIIINHNLSIMLRPNMGTDKDMLLIYIDEGRFGQS